MKEAIILTKEEYQNLTSSINTAKRETNEALLHLNYVDYLLEEEKNRSSRLWELLNRPAIEAAAQKHENDFLDWCAEKAAEYEQKDFDDWISAKSKFYNNGRYNYCKCYGITEDEYDTHLKYYYDEWHPVETQNDKTEGWSDIQYYKYGCSFILSEAQDDVRKRYESSEQKYGPRKGPYWKLWQTFLAMREEGEHVDPDYGGFYR